MNYTPQYLKASSYGAFYAECQKLGLVEDGEIITPSHNHSMILIGKLNKATGVTLKDSEGGRLPGNGSIAWVSYQPAFQKVGCFGTPSRRTVQYLSGMGFID